MSNFLGKKYFYNLMTFIKTIFASCLSDKNISDISEHHDFSLL
jgi:hypothetical protein